MGRSISFEFVSHDCTPDQIILNNEQNLCQIINSYTLALNTLSSSFRTLRCYKFQSHRYYKSCPIWNNTLLSRSDIRPYIRYKMTCETNILANLVRLILTIDTRKMKYYAGDQHSFTPKLSFISLWLFVWSWSNFYIILFTVLQFTVWSFKDGCAELFEMLADKKCPLFLIRLFECCCGHMTLWCHSCLPLIGYEYYSRIFN